MYLLDTNHCSRLLDGDPAVIDALRGLGDATVATSVIVRGELIYMVEHSKRRRENAMKVASFLKSILIIPVNNEIADLYGRLKARIVERFGPRAPAKRGRIALERLGFAENDLWIAATTIVHGLILVTADADFDRIMEVMPGLRSENWIARTDG